MFGIGKNIKISGIDLQGDPIEKTISVRELNKNGKKVNIQDLYLIEVFVGSGVETWIVGLDIERTSVEEYRKDNEESLFFGEMKVFGKIATNHLICKERWKKQCLLDYLLFNDHTITFTENDAIHGNVNKPSHLPIDENEWKSLFLEISQKILNTEFSFKTNKKYYMEVQNYRNIKSKLEIYNKIIKEWINA